MKAENINPFIESVMDVFESMLECEATMGELSADAEESTTPDIIGVIGLSGTAQGIVALRLPVRTALAIIGKMVGTEFRSIDSSIIDGVGELVNIIAGSAKARFKGHSISLSLPTVVRGSIYKLNNLSNTVWLTVPFTSDLGSFFISVCFKSVTADEKEGIHASVSR